MPLIKLALSALLLITAILLLASCSGSESSDTAAQANADQSATVDLSSTAKHFSVYDINGSLHNSSEWIGKRPVVLNFWGTWCPPCRKEIPDLVRLYAEFAPKGVEILGLAVRDTPEKVASFSKSNDMQWVMLMAEPSVLETYGPIRGVPTTIFLDTEGNEVARFVGPPSYRQFKDAFEAITLQT